jgi:membrane-associated protease RseP (regulator of RpoE activity)
MTALVYTMGVVLFALGVIASIALHEVGHMYPAKKFGVKVTQYFVGFGKTVWSVKKGDTEYGVKAIPMGGFIRMVGMLPPAKRGPDGRVLGFSGGFFGKLIADARAVEYEHVTEEDQDRLFYRKEWWKKVIIMSGGPMMNVFLAVVLLSTVFMGFGVKEPTLTVDQVSDCVIPASQPDRACRTGANADPLAPAREAGFHKGDQILSVNGQQVSDWDEFTDLVRSNGAGAIDVVVERNGVELTLSTHTRVSERLDLANPDQYVQVGFLGVLPTEIQDRKGPTYVATTLGDYTQRTGQALLHMPERMAGVAKAAFGLEDRDPNGPMSVVGASRVAGEVASEDRISVGDRWATLLTLLGVVNLFVALFNFIPLLPLDGGHIAGALYEALRRGIARLRGRPDPGYVDVAQLLPIAYAAATVLIVMGALLVWADIVNPIRISG